MLPCAMERDAAVPFCRPVVVHRDGGLARPYREAPPRGLQSGATGGSTLSCRAPGLPCDTNDRHREA
jgi:hypothetical protein